MLTSTQLDLIHGAGRTMVSWPAYQDFLDLLDDLRRQSPSSPVDETEVLTHYLAAIGWPRDCGPIPPATIKALAQELQDLKPTQLTKVKDQSLPVDYDLAVDRVTVFGLLDRTGSGGGRAGQWPACRARLEGMVTKTIEKPIRWIFQKESSFRSILLAEERAGSESDERIRREAAQANADWESEAETTLEAGQKQNEKPSSPAELLRLRQERELDLCRTALTNALIDGTCICIAKADDFGNRPEDAVDRCAQKHNLAAWDRRKPLQLFVQTATVDQGLKNSPSFGKTMLAAVVLDGLLVSGYVLVCEKCGGWIEADDHCSRCKELSQVTNNQKWYWLDGQRVARAARRCGRCGNLYYQHFGQCPNCQSHTWGAESEGSVRRRDFDAASTLDLVGDSDIDPAAHAAARDWLDRLRAIVSAWPPSREKDAIWAVLWPSPNGPRPDQKTLRKALARLWQEETCYNREAEPEEIEYWLADLQDALLKLRKSPGQEDQEAEGDEGPDADEG